MIFKWAIPLFYGPLLIAPQRDSQRRATTVVPGAMGHEVQNPPRIVHYSLAVHSFSLVVFPIMLEELRVSRCVKHSNCKLDNLDGQ